MFSKTHPGAHSIENIKQYSFQQAIQMQMLQRERSHSGCEVHHHRNAVVCFDKARSKESEEQAFKTSNNSSSYGVPITGL